MFLLGHGDLKDLCFYYSFLVNGWPDFIVELSRTDIILKLTTIMLNQTHQTTTLSTSLKIQMIMAKQPGTRHADSSPKYLGVD